MKKQGGSWLLAHQSAGDLHERHGEQPELSRSPKLRKISGYFWGVDCKFTYQREDSTLKGRMEVKSGVGVGEEDRKQNVAVSRFKHIMKE